MDRIPNTGEFYRHFKDKLYQIITVAEHTETGEQMVVYQALYGDYRTYIRPLEMFTSEVDHEKYPRARQKYRFEKVSFERGKEQNVEEGDEDFKVESRELNPQILSFIEAETCDKKLEQLAGMRGKIRQKDLDILYISEDMKPVSGTLEDQLYAVEQYLMMQRRYEGRRLR